MTQRHEVPPYRLDLTDPRAPTVEQWAAMTKAERDATVAALPSEFDLDEASPPEGDRHFKARATAVDTLSSFFARIGRRIYVASEIPVYYPGERMFSGDVVAVTDVELRERESWMVAREGKGLEFVLEIIVSGRRRKDLVENPARYARLGIAEYFVFDLPREQLWGWRLPPQGTTYASIDPVGSTLPSRVLGLELSLEGSRLRFSYGQAAVPQADELIGRLQQAVADQTQRRHDEAQALQRALEQAETQLAVEREQREQEARLRNEAETRVLAERAERQRVEQQLVELMAELERVRRERPGS